MTKKIVSGLRLLPLAAMLGGCATLSELVDDPSVEHSRIRAPGPGETPHTIMTMREDNRLVRTSIVGGGLKVCAETQADAISARSARSAIDVTGRGALEDEVTRQLTLTYARTQISDVVRQLAWQLCNARLNGDIGEMFYQSSLRALQDQSMAALAGSSQSAKELLEDMKAIQIEAEKAAAAAREFDKARDLGFTTRTQERTKQNELRLKVERAEGCGRAAKNVEEYNACLAKLQ